MLSRADFGARPANTWPRPAGLLPVIFPALPRGAALEADRPDLLAMRSARQRLITLLVLPGELGRSAQLEPLAKRGDRLRPPISNEGGGGKKLDAPVIDPTLPLSRRSDRNSVPTFSEPFGLLTASQVYGALRN